MKRHKFIFGCCFLILFLNFLTIASSEQIYSTQGNYYEKITAISTRKGKKILELSNGKIIPINSVVKIRFSEKRGRSIFVGKTAIVALTNGDLLKGTIQTGSSLDVTVQAEGIGSISISLDYLKGVFFLEHILSLQKREDIFKQIDSLSPKKDLLFLKKGGQIPGVVQSIGSQNIQIQVKGVGNQKMSSSKISALRISPLGGAFRFPRTSYSKIYLKNGTLISGEIIRYENDFLKVKTFFEKTLLISYDKLLEVYFFNGNFHHLSDLKIHKIVTSKGMESMSGLSFPPKKDQNIMGNNMEIQGRVYRKGLGVHSKSRLTYDLQKKYISFVGNFGFDDSVNNNPNSYSPKIILRIFGDGKNIYDSGIFTPKDKLRKIQLSLDGYNKLEIEVDFGEPYDDTLGRINLVDSYFIKK